MFAEILPVREQEPTRERDKMFANGTFIHVRERAAFADGTEHISYLKSNKFAVEIRNRWFDGQF